MVVTENATSLRITIWRTFVPPRAIAHYAEGAASPVYFSDVDELRRDVFAWQVHEDIWGGIEDPNLREKLREEFVVAFGPFNQRREGNFDQLSTYLQQARVALRSAASAWSISGQLSLGQNEDSPTRINAFLAFYNQLLWIYETFKDVPAVSITVR